MNPQPFQTPPRWWPSRLSPRFIRLYTPQRNRALRQQGIESIEVQGTEIVAQAVKDGNGVLLVSNHSYHYDSYVLIEAGLRGKWFSHFVTAWQVFTFYNAIGQWVLQRHGCFSINREGNDTHAFREAVSILLAGDHPLVVFPEGDIYHSNDRVMPFREGAAAMALMARKKQVRPIVAIPCAMKCFYTVDPSEELHAMMDQLEAHIRWRPEPDLPLLDRIYRFGNGFLSLKEVEYLGAPRIGSVRERLIYLANTIVTQIRNRHELPARGNDLTERIRYLRGHVIRTIDRLRQNSNREKLPPDIRSQLNQLHEDLQDLFFVTQLSSYHGDYSAEKPTIERMAETIDKFEEDVFALQSPTPRGRRQAQVRFGTPIELNGQHTNAAELTMSLENEVQSLLDQINDEQTSQLTPSRPLSSAEV